MAKPTGGQGGQQPTLPTHGASTLPSVEVDSYNLELEDEEGFIGDKASKAAFRQILDGVRKVVRESGEDPLGDKPSDEISKKKLDALLAKGDAEAAAVVQTAVEDFAQQLATVIRRFLRLKTWRDTECIAMGGGFRDSRIGELAIGRAAIILKSEGIEVDLHPIHNDPHEAGLIGAAHLLPHWMVEGYDAILAVDVGGTNFRAGIVELNLPKAKDLSKARVADMKLWRHREEEEVKRDEAVQRLVEMLGDLVSAGEKKACRLAPVIGVGCPGIIREDGAIESGAQNLPGNWESSRFNLPHALRAQIPTIGEHETIVVMHNDAVVQGLSELPHLKEPRHWGVLTIGTGLGNARFSKRRKAGGKRSK
jgi:predicted NBD/HSP70 family sugar kinase